MDSSAIIELIDQLDDDVDDLEEALAPLLKAALSDSASKLPLLDKAKLYILVTYAIESVLFAYLRINGVKAREHPVFKELTRVKQYFDKIKLAETPPAERTVALDKGAASRFIKAGLSGNDKYDLEKAERQAKERARAHIKFEQLKQTEKKRKAEAPETPALSASSSSDSDSSPDDEEKSAAPKTKKKKVESNPGSDSASNPQMRQSKGKNKKKSHRSQEASNAEPDGVPSQPEAQKKKRPKSKKKKHSGNKPL